MFSSLGKSEFFRVLMKSHLAHYVQHKSLSTAAVYVAQELPRFRTAQHDPSLHTKDHLSKFYTIQPDVKKKLFSTGGIPKSLDILMKTFNEASVMVREAPLEIISFLQQMNFSHPTVRFVIYGQMGTGKTSSLIHLVHYGYASRYLLVHLPWVSSWTKRPKEVESSLFKEGRIDLPVESVLWLQHFKLQNSELMKELDLRTTKSYVWSKREVTEAGEPLMAIVEHGVQRMRHSSDCIAVLLKEIKYHSQFGKFKTLVIIDGVNAFYCKTNVKRPNKTLVPASEITIVRAFEKLLKNDWNNAAVITTVDILPFNRDASMLDPCTPRVLLGKEGFELLDPFIPICTSNYSDKEVDSVLDYYHDRLWIQSEKAHEDDGRKQLKFLSGYNPYMLMKLCDPL